MSKYDFVFKDRMMGLLAAAKSLSGRTYETVDDMAKDCIRLVDLLAADADRVARNGGNKPEVRQKTGDKPSAIEKFVRDNDLDREKFEEWLGTFFPEVKAGGIGSLTSAHTRDILERADNCLKKFKTYNQGESK